MVVYADGTTSASPLAGEQRDGGISCDVAGNAGAVDYIHGAIHSSWKVTTEL